MREGVPRAWRGSQAVVPMAPRVWSEGHREGGWRVEREAMGLGFGAGGETVRLKNGDGGRDDDSLHFYVAITLP